MSGLPEQRHRPQGGCQLPVGNKPRHIDAGHPAAQLQELDSNGTWVPGPGRQHGWLQPQEALLHGRHQVHQLLQAIASVGSSAGRPPRHQPLQATCSLQSLCLEARMMCRRMTTGTCCNDHFGGGWLLASQCCSSSSLASAAQCTYDEQSLISWLCKVPWKPLSVHGQQCLAVLTWKACLNSSSVSPLSS